MPPKLVSRKSDSPFVREDSITKEILNTGLFERENKFSDQETMNYMILSLKETSFFLVLNNCYKLNHIVYYWKSKDYKSLGIKDHTFEDIFDLVPENIRDQLIWHFDLFI